MPGISGFLIVDKILPFFTPVRYGDFP